MIAIQKNIKRMEAKDKEISALQTKLDEERKAIDDKMKKQEQEVQNMRNNHETEMNLIRTELAAKNDLKETFGVIVKVIENQSKLIEQMHTTTTTPRPTKRPATFWDPLSWF